MTELGWIIIALITGGLVGAAAVWLWAGRAGRGRAVEALKKENEAFREQVTEHFVETAGLINDLTDSYKKVFDHLAAGADRLVDRKALIERMPKVDQDEVRLKRIGAPVPENRDDRRAGPVDFDTGESAGSKPSGGRPAVKEGAVRSPLKAGRPKRQ